MERAEAMLREAIGQATRDGSPLVLVLRDDELVVMDPDGSEVDVAAGKADLDSIDRLRLLHDDYPAYDQRGTGFAWANSMHPAVMLGTLLRRELGGRTGNGDWLRADTPRPSTPKPPLTAVTPPRNRKQRRKDKRQAARLLKASRKRPAVPKPVELRKLQMVHSGVKPVPGWAEALNRLAGGSLETAGPRIIGPIADSYMIAQGGKPLRVITPAATWTDEITEGAAWKLSDRPAAEEALAMLRIEWAAEQATEDTTREA